VILDNDPNKTEPPPATVQKDKGFSTQFGLAMELPFVFVAAVGLGGAIGYFLDHWLHTKVIFLLVFGGLGFFAGLREILRRLPG
jgi:F0F1-type ATP synthase assembly protein I